MCDELFLIFFCERDTVLIFFPSEAMIGKFVRKYANDPTYNRLTAAVEAKNWKDAFLAAHTLKGVAQNLGFDRLQKSASALTEAVRGAVPLTDESLFEEVCKDQKEIVEAIEKLD